MKIFYNPSNGLIVGETNDDSILTAEVSDEEWERLLITHKNEVGDYVYRNSRLQFEPHMWTVEEKRNYFDAVMNERRSVRSILLKAFDTVEIKSLAGIETLTDEIREWKQKALDLRPEAFANVPSRIKYFANLNDEQIADLGHPKADFDADLNERILP